MAGSVKNPYSHMRLESEYDAPDGGGGAVQETSAYTATSERAPYGLPNTPFAERLDVGADASPDDQRLGLRDGNDFRVDPARPRGLWERLFTDRRIRESVGRFFGTMPETKDPAASGGAARWVRRAGEIPVPESRPTQQMSPHNFGYIRPGDAMSGGTPRRFTGVHGSLASYDNLGDHTQYGMAPPRQARSTVLRNLVPWGENRVDTSGQSYDYTDDTIESVQEYAGGAPTRGRSFRLGS